MIKEKTGFGEAMESYHDALTNEDVIKCKEEMDQIRALAELPRHPLIHEVPPLGRFAVFILLAALDVRGVKRSEDVQREMQKQRSRQPRKPRKAQEKVMVQSYWNRWQENPKLYSGIPEFIDDMREKTGIEREGTFRDWIAEFKRKQRLAG